MDMQEPRRPWQVPRAYTTAEQRVIEAAARRYEDAAVAKLRADIDAYERGSRW